MRKRRLRTGLAAAFLIASLLGTIDSAAAVDLRFTPERQHLEIGETGSLSVVIDEAIDVRTVELWIRFDPVVVTGQGGSPGDLYAASGCPLFPVFEPGEPGQWYAGVVSLGPDCYPTGPGELYRWNFQAAADGTCPVTVDSVKIYDAMAVRIPDVSLAPAVIHVGTATAAGPPRPIPLSLELAPNPFNPRTEVSFAGVPGETAAVTVHDIRGRLVGSLWSGALASVARSVGWNGTDDRGRTVPSGVYVFRIRNAAGDEVVRKGILLK